MCHDAQFKKDELLPVFKTADKSIKDHVSRDRKNGYSKPAFIPTDARNFLYNKLPTPYGVANPDSAPSVTFDAMKHDTIHHASKPRTPPM